MAYGICETVSLPPLRSFEAARDFFNRTTPLRGNGMEPNERPMHPKRGGAYKKYRVAKVQVKGIEAYDLVFYDTPCIRYFAPNPDGSHHVSIRYYSSSSTREFMWRHSWGGSSMRMHTDDDEEVYVPYCQSIGSAYPSAFLTFDINNRLITSRSWHAPLCKHFSSNEDKQKRKDFKRILETMFDLLYVQEQEIRLEALRNVGKYGWHYASERSDAVMDISNYVNALRDNPNAEVMLRPNTVEFLVNNTALSLREVAGRAAYKEASEKYPDYRQWTERREFEQVRTPVLIQTMDMKIPITEVRDDLLARGGFMGKNKHVQLPMFLPEPPKGQFFHDRKGTHYPEDILLDKYKNV